MSGTKRVAFADYHLDNFHANLYIRQMRETLAGRGFDVTGCHAIMAAEGREWAAKNNVPYYDDPAEMNRAADYFMVLAPSNPETHLELARMVVPFGKPTYVDKTFAPDLAAATEIFSLADKHGTPLQTSSALRYTNIQTAASEMGKILHMAAWGAGSSFGEYAIHAVEMLVSCMGPDARSVMRRGQGDHSQLLVNYAGGRTAVVNVYCNAATPFAAVLTSAKETRLVPQEGDLFLEFLKAQLDFFDSGKAAIDRRESLMIRQILDAADDPAALKDFVPLDTGSLTP